MNKHLHRIVFNAARGLRMVVQETAKSTGRGARKATSGGTGAGAGSAAVSVAAIAAALMSAPLHAQIVADPGAPGGQRPTVLVAPNGVPLVNIQTPSAAGVSRNAYSQFDVQRNGAILNNSRGNAQTQLGGWVQGNPWLATGSARVILNEVNSANPSQLRGYVEVAGPRTEVIIANPAGIQVQGGGFTNWRRVTTPVSLDFFDYAISTLCGAPEQTELIVTFLGYIRQEVERALTEPLRWEDEDRGAWGFPFMKATRWYDLQRSDLYSRALLGEPFTVEDRHFEALQGSAADWAAETGRNWDESSQSKYIECALVALAWGRLDMAQSLLKVRRSFKWTQRYVDWSRELVAQLAVQAPGQPVSQDSALWANFHSLFDELRHPTRTNKTGEASRDAARRGEARSSSEPSLLRLALAMIKQRWLLNKPIEPGLRDVIALISE